MINNFRASEVIGEMEDLYPKRVPLFVYGPGFELLIGFATILSELVKASEDPAHLEINEHKVQLTILDPEYDRVHELRKEQALVISFEGCSGLVFRAYLVITPARMLTKE